MVPDWENISFSRELLVLYGSRLGKHGYFSGIIGFVWLMVPHISRMIIGCNYVNVLPASAIIGAIFLLWADITARTIMAPEDIPIGIVTGLVGGIFFVWLLGR